MDSYLDRQLRGPAGQGSQRVAVSLLKGGVAKSGTAVSLAHALAQNGFRVLLVDTDVQAQCNDMLGVNPARGLAEVIAGFSDPWEALCEARENLWLLAGGNQLAAVKMEIARREMAPEAVLAEALEPYEESFDYLVMDTAPGWDTLLVNALYCCQHVLSPVSMEPVALSGLLRFEERLGVIQKYNNALALRWIVPTFVDGRVRKTAEIMSQLQERYGERLGPPIKYSVKLSEAPAFGKTILEHDPRGQAAEGYRLLARRVLADCPPRAGAARPAVQRPPSPAAPCPEPAAPGEMSDNDWQDWPAPDPCPPAEGAIGSPAPPLSTGSGPEAAAEARPERTAPGLAVLPRLARPGLRQRLGQTPPPQEGDQLWREVRERLVRDGRS